MIYIGKIGFTLEIFNILHMPSDSASASGTALPKDRELRLQGG